MASDNAPSKRHCRKDSSVIDLEEMRKELKEIITQNPEKASLLMDDMSDDPYGVSMLELASMLLLFQEVKDAGYGRSWAKRGDVGVFHNVMRKKDRYEQLGAMLEGLEMSSLSGFISGREKYKLSMIDLLADIASYCMMWMSYISRKNPELFKKWVEEYWTPFTGIEYDAVVTALGRMEEP